MRIYKRLVFMLVLMQSVLVGSAFAGSEHAFGRAAGNCGGVWRLPDTGQTICYNDVGGVIGCPAPEVALAQDGSYVPTVIQPSYTVYYGGVGTSSYTMDNRTGLMWVTNPNDNNVSSGTYTWENAIILCENLTYAGYGPGAVNNGWRLPNIKELQSIVDYGTAASAKINGTYFLNTQANYYWSSTTYVPDTAGAWVVYFGNGFMNTTNKTTTYYVRCVRGGP